MNNPTKQQLDWMKHGLRTLTDRLNAPKYLTKAEVRQLRSQIADRQSVLDTLAANRNLPVALEPTYTLMLTMADLHIRWYAREITTGEFLSLASLAHRWVQS